MARTTATVQMMAARRVVAATLLIMPSLGALYAWSVLAEPLELQLGIARSETSLVFSLATASFTVTMMAASRLQRRLSASALALLAMATAAAGLALAAAGGAYWALLLGIGGLFGLANGIGYAMCLQAVHAAVVRRRGLVTGVVVAAYGGGAAVFAPAFAWMIRAVGATTTMAATAGLMAVVGIIAALLLRPAGLRLHAGQDAAAAGVQLDAVFRWLWLGFLAGTAAGVMALGHAATLATAYGAGAGALILATVLVALGNAAGRLTGGWMGDRLQPRRSLAATQLLLAVAFVPPLVAPGVPAVLATLLLAGIGYGATASLYPLAVAHYYGAARLGSVYGRLYSAWGVAALVAPWFAGLLFDWTGGYGAAVVMGLATGAIACFTSLLLPKPEHADGAAPAR